MGSDDKADSQSEKAAAQSGTAKDADQDRDNSKAAETGNDQAQSQTRDGAPQDSSGQQAATAGASSAASTGSAAGAGAGADDAHGADHGDEPAALPELSEDDIAFIEDHMVNSFIAQSGVKVPASKVPLFLRHSDWPVIWSQAAAILFMNCVKASRPSSRTA